MISDKYQQDAEVSHVQRRMEVQPEGAASVIPLANSIVLFIEQLTIFQVERASPAQLVQPSRDKSQLRVQL